MLPTGLSTAVNNPGGRGQALLEGISASRGGRADHTEDGLGIDRLPGHDSGQPNHELASPTRPFAEDLDAPAVELDQPAHERKPHADPPLRASEPAVALDGQVEHVREQARRNPDSRVGYADDRLFLFPVDANANRSAGRGVLDRVG